MPNTERTLKALRLRRSKAEDEAQTETRNENSKYYQEGVASGLEIAEMIVKKIDREEKDER